MATTSIIPAQIDDGELVSLSLGGDRQAFGQIVERYQTLVCSLAFSATGSVPQSEDLAQETFVIAWRKLGELHEPGKLPAWLCGIARNLANNFRRRQERDPLRGGVEIDERQASEEPAPDEQAMRREEQAILWRALQRIPTIYREPLVLFYRQEQSVAQLAAALELSEEAARKRLSRGRKLLAARLGTFVEGALRQSAPGKGFTLGVLAALPLAATGAKAAAVGSAAAKGSALAKSAAIVGAVNLLLGPVVGILGGYIGARAGLRSTRTPRERKFLARRIWLIITACTVFDVLIALYIMAAVQYWKVHPVLFVVLGVAIPISVTTGLLLFIARHIRQFSRIRTEEQALHPEAYGNAGTVLIEYRSRRTLLGLPLVHLRTGTPPGEKPRAAIGWIAIGDKAVGILFAAGGMSIGAISMGGLSVGIISFGGIGVGVLALAGLAIGGWTLGGFAIGMVAAGGMASGWHAAVGGLAVAREFAVGGEALARHANDAMAGDYIGRYPWLDVRKPLVRNVGVILCWLPVILLGAFWPGVRRKRRARVK